MSSTITIVIPNRNRDLTTVRRTLLSIVPQLKTSMQLVIVDYGSEKSYQLKLEKLVESFSDLKLILCPTQGQLWNKSRCINIVLKACSTTHLMVCDMDMIWHPEFLKTQISTFSLAASVYYTVGIMTEEESALEKAFLDYDIKFATNEEATGITVFPTEQLRSINGFDEFYHGWGSEDTDAHVRLQNAGYKVSFNKSEIFFKHQWHAKSYRNLKSNYPYHTLQERINAFYLNQTIKRNKITCNNRFQMGVMPLAIDSSDSEIIAISSLENEIKGILHQFSEYNGNCSLQVDCNSSFSLKQTVKRLIKNNLPRYLSLEQVNNLILEWIIHNARNSSYTYKIKGKVIFLKIELR